VGEVEPVVLRPGAVVDRDELVARLVHAGYRREYQVEHRGEVAVRGSIVDVYPSTADIPVRIDLWGDEVDRLTTFSVSDQRSRDDVGTVEIFPCRELLPTEAVRERAAALVRSQPWGREHWERLAEGQTFDGMESWLPWLTADEHVLLDLVPAEARVVLIEPRRMRDRAADLLAEEADLAGVLARTWGADPAPASDGSAAPFRLHLPFDRLLTHTTAPVLTVTNTADGPDAPAVQAHGFDPVVGGSERMVAQLRNLLADGYRVVLAADSEGSATRMAEALGDEGIRLERGGDPTRPGGHVVVTRLERGCILPASRLAVVGEQDVTGRRRAHRVARTRTRDTAGFFPHLKPGDFVVHVQHGVGRYGGMVKRAIGGVVPPHEAHAFVAQGLGHPGG